MIELLRALFNSPEAERNAEAWATRFAAHTGIGCIIWLSLVGIIGPVAASALCVIGYASFEMLQWRGGWRMALDGVLDFVAFAFAVCGLYAAWYQQNLAASASGLSAIIVAAAGIHWRNRPKKGNQP